MFLDDKTAGHSDRVGRLSNYEWRHLVKIYRARGNAWYSWDEGDTGLRSRSKRWNKCFS